jgi:hypothetical protein
MLSIFREECRPGRSRPSRREVLRLGALGGLGLTLPDLARLRAATGPEAAAARHRHNACVFVFLFGGPSHIDLWDMKPEAPAEIRGEFRPIATTVPGLRLCEHLPGLARVMDRFCLVRSMTHQMPVHGPACSEIYTGRPYFGAPTTDQERPEDWPSLSSLVTRFGPRPTGWPPAIVLPWLTQFTGQDRPIAGQVGGRMGASYRPFLVAGDPSQPGFQVPGIRLPGDLPVDRAAARFELLRRLELRAEGPAGPRAAGAAFREQYATAMAMINDARAARSFELAREPQAVRDRYGPSKFAQSLLLARRLVEAGIALVTVNWDDESRADHVSPFWDTHHDNFPTLKDRLAPRFDRAFSAFLDDLHARGLLETTLVVVTGEFGRTPRIGQRVQNAMTQKTGRDHWPHAFTVLLAGGGVRGGHAYGATDRIGAHVADNPVTPADLAATVLDHLGIDSRLEYWDEFQQVRRRLCEGTPLRGLS